VRIAGRIRRNGAVLGATAAVALLAGIAAGVPAASGGFSATIANSADTAGTARYFKCFDAISPDLPSAYFEWPLSDQYGALSSLDLSGNNRTPTFVGTTAMNASDPLGCRRDGGSALRFDGSTTYAYQATKVTNPQTFTLEVYFQTSVKAGKLIGFGANSTTASGTYDRHLYIGSDGTLVFGIYNGGYRTLTSSKVVADGAWHHAAATLSSNGMKLYVDGVLAASNASYTTAETNNGYWRVGYDALSTSWPKSSGNGWFTGRMRGIGVYNVELTAQQIADHAAPTF
jgi:hypothetical protein